ncbi:hypothetical protein B0T17DRAFT_507840 [Bombardia bombarda]|uniref:NAD(P)-binding domain-containing protein n=1 Tax=Bombardia bombarda TaxID=252184 RepID=A0AA39X039_9PEZI|nr:hypothetical protein B0T17DRAFT_507840 [Bombardia bombarda]
MKVIVTGATGLVGSALVRQCIANQAITHVFILSRKPLPESTTSNPKVTLIIHNNFATYPSALLDQLAGAEGCLWAIGGKVSDFNFDVDTCRKVSIDYTLAAARAFIAHLAPQLPEGRKFRFVFCSGKYAEWDQQKPLHFLADTRRIKGQVEQQLCELADDSNNRFEVYCPRPSGIHPPDVGLATRLVGKMYAAIPSDHLAKAMVHMVLEGYDKRIIENDELWKI